MSDRDSYREVCSELADLHREYAMVLSNEYHERVTHWRAAEGVSMTEREWRAKVGSATSSTEAIRILGDIKALEVRKSYYETIFTLSD